MTGRLLSRTLLGAALAAAGVLGIASSARAQTPAPTPTPLPTLLGGTPMCDGLTGHGLDICKAHPHLTMPGGACFDSIHDPSGLDFCLKLHENSAPRPILDLGGQMIPGDVGARFPLGAYDLGYSDSNPADGGRKFQGTMMKSGWSIHTIFIRFGLFSVSWAFSFGIASRLAAPAADSARMFTTHLIGPFAIGHVALMLTGIVIGILLFRGKGAKAAGELAITYTIYAVMGIMLANPAGYLRGAYSTVSDVSGQILTASTDPTQGLANAPPAANSFDHPEFAARLGPLKKSVAEALIDKPFDQVQWGEILSGKCALIRDAILLTGPWGNDNAPRQMMATQPECAKYADINADPATGDRWMWAWFFALLSFLVMILLVGIAITVVGAQLWGVFLVVAMPVAAAFGLGPGHKAIWKWTTSAAKAAGAILACSGLLVFFVMLFAQGLKQTQNDAAAVKLVFLGTTTVGAFVAKKHFLAASAAGAAALGTKLGSLGSGGGFAPVASKPHKVGKTVLGISAAGAAQRFAHKLPGRIASATVATAKKVPGVAAGAVVAGKAVGRQARQLGAYGNILALAGAVPIQNRIADARDRRADALALPDAGSGSLTSHLNSPEFAAAQARVDAARAAQERQAKIKAGMAAMAERQRQEAARAALAARQAAEKDAFHARVQAAAKKVAADRALKDIADRKAKRPPPPNL